MSGQESIPSATISFERTSDFINTYANSVMFESSAWDLRLLFGQLDQVSGAGIIKQHLGVTIPWPQAKLMLFWLRLQVEAAEMGVNARIPIRKDLLPQEAPELTPEQEQDPANRAVRELYIKLREEFLASV
jgi:hypothetical protein